MNSSALFGSFSGYFWGSNEGGIHSPDLINNDVL